MNIDSPCKTMIRAIGIQFRNNSYDNYWKKTSVKDNYERINKGLHRLKESTGDTLINYTWASNMLKYLSSGGRLLSVALDGNIYDILETYELKNLLGRFNWSWDEVWNYMERDFSTDHETLGTVNKQIVLDLKSAFCEIREAVGTYTILSNKTLVFEDFMRDQDENLVYLY